MSANDRIEQLLNKAGETIVDIPPDADEKTEIIDRMERALINVLRERDDLLAAIVRNKLTAAEVLRKYEQ